MVTPLLKTKRLVLRKPEFPDWERYQKFMASENAIYMGGPFTKESAWGWYCSDIAQWMLFGHGALMLQHNTSGACLGQVCINHGPLFPEHELGWYLYPEAEGYGYAYEAAFALREWAVELEKVATLVSYISPENHRSRRLAEKLGAVIDVDAARLDKADLVYRHPIA